MSEQSLASMLPPQMVALKSKPLMTFFVEVKKPAMLGVTPTSDRRIGEIAGGRFEGERLRGKFLPGGSDWQTLRPDGAVTINVRVVLETDDNQLIAMTYTGLRHGPREVIEAIARGEQVDPTAYYMRVVPVFETASEKYGWLNRIVAVAHGHRLSTGAIYNVWEVI
jgi:hypothetical protein